MKKLRSPGIILLVLSLSWTLTSSLPASTEDLKVQETKQDAASEQETPEIADTEVKALEAIDLERSVREAADNSSSSCNEDELKTKIEKLKASLDKISCNSTGSVGLKNLCSIIKNKDTSSDDPLEKVACTLVKSAIKKLKTYLSSSSSKSQSPRDKGDSPLQPAVRSKDVNPANPADKSTPNGSSDSESNIAKLSEYPSQSENGQRVLVCKQCIIKEVNPASVTGSGTPTNRASLRSSDLGSMSIPGSPIYEDEPYPESKRLTPDSDRPSEQDEEPNDSPVSDAAKVALLKAIPQFCLDMLSYLQIQKGCVCPKDAEKFCKDHKKQ